MDLIKDVRELAGNFPHNSDVCDDNNCEAWVTHRSCRHFCVTCLVCQLESLLSRAEADGPQVQGPMSDTPSVMSTSAGSVPEIPGVVLPDAETLAQMFHAQYELLAPKFGYQTRFPGSMWSELPENNRKLMIAVAQNILVQLEAAQVSTDGEPLQADTGVKSEIDARTQQRSSAGMPTPPNPIRECQECGAIKHPHPIDVIEECAQIADEQLADWAAKPIRALKHKYGG